MFRISHTFQRFHICKIRVVHNNTDTLGCINRRATTQSYNKVGSGSFVSCHTVLHICNSRISFYITIKFVRNLILIKHLDDFGSYPKLNQVFIKIE